MSTIIKIRRDTASAWTSANPVLAGGELAWETDTGKLKIGNGAANWAALPYEVGRAALQTLADAVGLKYSKPSGGIPATDLATAVVASLAKADAAATPAQVQAKIDALVSGAPGVLDTLDELAAALGDDPNAVATLTTAIAAKYTKPSSGIPLTDVATAAAASLRDRSTHTGTQATSTIVGLDTALAAKYAKPSSGIPETDLTTALSTKLAEDVTQGQLTDAIAGIVGGSPTNLRNLSELAGAMGEDGNLTDTLNGLLAQKYTKPTGGIPTTDLSQPVRDALVSIAANTAAIAALQVTVDQILNPPAAPPTAITLTATAGDGQVTLTRTGGESTTSSGASTSTAYALYRGTDATGTLLATKLPYTDTGRTNGTAIAYFVTAKNNAGTVSASATATPAATPLPTPTFAFRAADITGVADLGAVSSVPAGFGAGPAWAQSDTALQPSYRAAFNGRPALYCGGVLRTASGIAYTSRGFVIGRVWFDAAPNSTADQGIAASDDGPISNAVRLWRLSGAKAGLLKGIAWNNGTARTDTASGLTGGGWRVVAVRWGGGTVETFIDGVSDGATAGSVGTTGNRTVLLGGSYVSSGAVTESMRGYVNELRGYYQALTTDEINALFADMGVVRS